MTQKRSEIRNQGSDVAEQETARLEQLLRQAMPPIGEAPAPQRDLWPAMQRRFAMRPSAPPWFDWAMAGGLAAAVIVFPAWIPVFLYYL